MNKKIKTIGIIVAYPEKGERHSNFSGIAGYTKNLLLGFTQEQREKSVVFSNIKSKAKIFEDDEIEVNECWKRNSIFFEKHIIENIKKYPVLNTIHIQHEFNLFGGSLSILLYLLLLRKIKKSGKKIIVTYHGVISQKIIDGNFKKLNQLNFPVFLVKFFFSFIYRLSARYIDKCIVHENYFENILIEEYGFKKNKIEVIHHGIEDNALMKHEDALRKLGISSDKKIVLFFGFLAGYKGVNLLLNAFDLLNKDKYFLILAGGKPKRVENDESYEQWFKRIKKRIKNYENILMTGFVPDDQIALYFSAADVLVLPYLQMLSASGPMSFALSFEKPFLASDVFREVLENDQIIFQRNKENLKNAIEKFFEKKDYFENYIKKRKNERLWSKIGKITFDTYSKIK